MESAPPEKEERPLSFVAAALWTLLVALLVGGAVTIIEAAHPGAFGDVVTISACKLLGYSVVFFAILRVHEPDSSIRQVLALRRPPVVMIFLALVVGAGMAPVAMWVETLLANRYPPTPVELEAIAKLVSAPTPGKKIALVLALGLVTPVCDALFFGGALFTPLKKGRRAESVVLAIAAYDTLLGAPNPRDVASMLGAALALAWIRAVSGSVIPAVAARVAFFAVQVAPLLAAEEPKLPKTAAIGGAVAATLGLAAIAAVGKRSARVLDARLEDT